MPANRKLGYGDSYNVIIKLTGEKEGIVSDSIKSSIVSGNARVTLKSADDTKNEYVYTITPTKSGEGTVKFTCGAKEEISK